MKKKEAGAFVIVKLHFSQFRFLYLPITVSRVRRIFVGINSLGIIQTFPHMSPMELGKNPNFVVLLSLDT